MSRLADAFDRLIAARPVGDPDDVLAAARSRAAAARARRRALAGLGTAAAAAVLVVGTVVLTDDAPDEVRTGPSETTPTEAAPAPTTTEPSVAAGPEQVEVHFSPADDESCDETVGVPREVDADQPIAAALAALLAGPTADEAAAGLTSWFSDATAGRLRHVELADGTAHVDFFAFASIIPNASTSCGSTNLLAQLDATTTQFDGVDRAIYSFDGSPEAFYSWLQRDVPDGARPDLSYQGAEAGTVTAGADGVALDLGGRDQLIVTEEPAAVAYAVGGSYVAYQRRDPASGRGSVAEDGPIMGWRSLPGAPPESFELPAGSAGSLVVLHDAGWVAGRPVALIAERTGSSPDDTVEALVEIDLATRERTVVVERAAWESSHRGARLLANGDVVGLVDTEARTDLVRWSSGLDEPLWTNELDIDQADGLASGGGRVSLVERPVWQEQGTAMAVADIDLTTGSLASPRQFTVVGGADGGGGSVPRCHDWWTSDVLVCSVVAGPPVLIDVAGPSAEIQPLEAPIDATVTPVR